MIKVQLDADGFKRSLYQMVNDAVNASLRVLNEKDLQNEDLKTEEDFIKMFMEIFKVEAPKILPEKFLDIMDIQFDIKVDLKDFTVAIDFKIESNQKEQKAPLDK